MSSLVSSKHQKLSTEEIIAIAAKEAGQGETFEQVKASLTAEAYEAKALMMREGNTIFVVHQSKEMPTLGILRTLNADVVPNFCKNCVVFAKALGMAGFKQFVTVFPKKDKGLLSVIKYVVNKQPPFPNMSYQVKRGSDNSYIVIIDLGDTKKGGLPDKASPKTEGAL